MFGGGGAPAAPAAAGLPFGGIPSELQDGVDELWPRSPTTASPPSVFSQQQSAKERPAPQPAGTARSSTPACWSVDGARRHASVALQAGPKLTELAIDKGMVPGHHHLGVVIVIAAVYLAFVAFTAVAQRAQVRVTGRLAAWVMNDLRVKVFSHLQRLSLDFFTAEKAGVIMTRMTSDIENLQQLLQDGLAQFAMQGLTMVIITVILFTTNVTLALITVLPGRPRSSWPCPCGSGWPPSAATTGCATASPT